MEEDPGPLSAPQYSAVVTTTALHADLTPIPTPASLHILPSPPMLLNISEFLPFEEADDPLLLQNLHNAFEASAKRSREVLGKTICTARNDLNVQVDAASEVYFANVERACDEYKARVVAALSSHKAQVERINAHIRALVGMGKGEREGEGAGAEME
ncbi:uncharacterized protein LOC62_03G005071 [Vanrija pseudolonga]|uniref:Uncharacterized protein n=1 Tax=Vanrija pseudolonga TaxID=143232 RepID=A0AAF0Y7N1_9TREE|nr:hypothetical protein LOC62_03G005071 [Vanrija pseudolonga]